MSPGERPSINLEELLNSVAHTLHSPLHAIGNLAHVVEAGYAGAVNETIRKHMGNIGAANQRLKAVLEPLLTLIQASEMPLHPARFDSQEVITEALKDLKPVATHFPTQPSTIRVDFAAFRLALTRLVTLMTRFANPEALNLWVSLEAGYLTLCFQEGDQPPVAAPSLETLPPEWLQDEAGIDLLTVARLIRRQDGTFWASGLSEERSIRLHIALPVEAVKT